MKLYFFSLLLAVLFALCGCSIESKEKVYVTEGRKDLELAVALKNNIPIGYGDKIISRANLNDTLVAYSKGWLNYDIVHVGDKRKKIGYAREDSFRYIDMPIGYLDTDCNEAKGYDDIIFLLWIFGITLSLSIVATYDMIRGQYGNVIGLVRRLFPLIIVTLSVVIALYFKDNYYQTWFCDKEFLTWGWASIGFVAYSIFIISNIILVGYFTYNLSKREVLYFSYSSNDVKILKDNGAINIFVCLVAVLAYMLVNWLFDWKGTLIWIALGIGMLCFISSSIKHSRSQSNILVKMLYSMLYLVVIGSLMYSFYFYVIAFFSLFINIIIGIVVVGLFIFGSMLGGGESSSSDSSSSSSNYNRRCMHYNSLDGCCYCVSGCETDHRSCPCDGYVFRESSACYYPMRDK